ncbi:response regulator FixJ [Methylovirgula sp. 4M-Z18]|uniref:response regulator FixJ n=1 Tax=Methylovirgula sp. 4M-Z18 TaxID=2293567 RepID=UPI000E2FC334|nr:response regulator FixJ [Methylovirgula sp. 4M-Z18]RFB76477.1 response regulator [Methylovirgula sp. 4M-Z18]
METNGVIHLIDDDDAVRQSLAFCLATAGHAVRAYESAEAFLAALSGLQPGCIVSDIRMPGLDGLQLQRHLNEKGVALPMIIMTGHGDVRLAVEAMKAGAVDFIEKPFDDDVLLAAIVVALDRYAEHQRHNIQVDQIRTRLETLSPREREVLQGLVAGHPNKTIAYDLNISARTVEVYRANVMNKMGARSLSELVRMALATNIAPNGVG